MRVLPVTDESIREAVSIIQEGGVVAHATETCYGLACDLENPEAVLKLFRIKERPYDRPVSGLFPTVENAKEYAEWYPEADELAEKFLPGPLTIILPLHEPKRFFVTPHGGANIGVRVSSHPLAKALATECNMPISTTSANLHGKPNPYTVADILMQFKDRKFLPDIILDSGTLPFVPPSTVIDLTGEEPEEKREGDVKLR